MDSIDLLILALRFLFVALLYVFLLVVLRLSTVALRRADQAIVRNSRQLELVVVEPGASGLAAGEVIAVPDGGTLGRAEHADVVLADAAISSEHARLERVKHQWVITDLGSTNGTRINDAVVQARARLRDGDVLQLGTVRMQVKPRATG